MEDYLKIDVPLENNQSCLFMSYNPNPTEKQIFSSLVETSPRIAIYGHRACDFDSLGASLGLFFYLRHAYPTKDIRLIQDPTWVPYDTRNGLFPLAVASSPSSRWVKGSLAILLDLGDVTRVNNPS